MLRAALLSLLCLALAGCESLSYYRQGVAGQLHFYGARVPIATVLQRDDLAPDVRRRLELVPQVRAFAKDELKLPVKGQYRDYVQLPSDTVLWSLFAAPELSLEPHRWCYLFHALCVEYRGYFDKAEAQRYADRVLPGMDTYLGGVSAFSSLGLLDDPVTSVLTGYPDDVMAMVLFHELAHSVVYVKDDTVFNESFAEAVADEGLARWLAAQGRTGGSDDVRRLQARQALLTRVALAVRADLATLYASSLPDDAKRARKREILAAAPDRYRAACAADPALALPGGGADCPHAAWFGDGLNNARLNAIATYEQRVPAFAAMIRATGGDLAAFYRTVRKLAKMPAVERDTVLRAMMPPAANGVPVP